MNKGLLVLRLTIYALRQHALRRDHAYINLCRVQLLAPFIDPNINFRRHIISVHLQLMRKWAFGLRQVKGPRQTERETNKQTTNESPSSKLWLLCLFFVIFYLPVSLVVIVLTQLLVNGPVPKIHPRLRVSPPCLTSNTHGFCIFR